MMSAKALVHELHDLGVSITALEDRLRLEPASQVPSRLVAALRQQKTEVLAYLRRGETSSWVVRWR